MDLTIFGIDTNQRPVWQGDNDAMDVLHMNQGLGVLGHALDLMLKAPETCVLGLPRWDAVADGEGDAVEGR